ncbi:MAG: hypothetical protein ABFS45_01585 [Pseudomonadota bacterium]
MAGLAAEKALCAIQVVAVQGICRHGGVIGALDGAGLQLRRQGRVVGDQGRAEPARLVLAVGPFHHAILVGAIFEGHLITQWNAEPTVVVEVDLGAIVVRQIAGHRVGDIMAGAAEFR